MGRDASEASFDRRPAQAADRADDVLVLARLATRREAVREILDWLARRTSGTVALLSGAGDTLATSTDAGGERSATTRSGGPTDAAGPEDAVAAAARVVPELYAKGTPSAVLSLDEPAGAVPHTLYLVSLASGGGYPTERGGTVEPAPYLAMVTTRDDGRSRRRESVLLSDAARTLSLCWRLEEAERARRRIETADAHSREAVLHLLMVGVVPAAQRIAAALRPPLPDLARLYVIECPGASRHTVASVISRVADGRAWIVPCPVRPNHLIVLVPVVPGAASGRDEAANELDQLLAEAVPNCLVGSSSEIPLRDTPVGYEQAFHALAVARTTLGGHARFNHRIDISPLIGPGCYEWANELLRPCVHYVPSRRVAPGPDELLSTLSSWLVFGGAAARHLNVHRNTLSARLRLINELLELDLRQLAHQSAAWLALRVHSPQPVDPASKGAGGSGTSPGQGRVSSFGASATWLAHAGRRAGPVRSADASATRCGASWWRSARSPRVVDTSWAARPDDEDPASPGGAGLFTALDELLSAPAATLWARAQLRPLEHAGASDETVRAWLRSDARLPMAADMLGISLPGVRKRLVKAESALGRSLLHAPSAKYELWLAMRSLGRL